MRELISTEPGVPTHPAVLSLIIIAREQQDLWRALEHEFKDVAKVQVLLDRRHGERRTPRGPVAYDRRASDRRSLPCLEDALHARQYVLVRPHDRRPHT
jgi:hypothetical protein